MPQTGYLRTGDLRNKAVTAEKLADTLDLTAAGKTLKVDNIAESTAGSGVTADGALLKDGGGTFVARVTGTDGVTSGPTRIFGGPVSVLQANGTAHTNSTDEAVLASYVIPANTIKAGTVVKVKFAARVSADAGATTLTGRLRLGTTTLTGTALLATSAVDTGVDSLIVGEYTLVGRAAPGAAAAVVGAGSYCNPGGVGAQMLSAALGATNFATNGALRLELTADWSAADANSIRAELFVVEIDG